MSNTLGLVVKLSCGGRVGKVQNRAWRSRHGSASFFSKIQNPKMDLNRFVQLFWGPSRRRQMFVTRRCNRQRVVAVYLTLPNKLSLTVRSPCVLSDSHRKFYTKFILVLFFCPTRFYYKVLGTRYMYPLNVRFVCHIPTATLEYGIKHEISAAEAFRLCCSASVVNVVLSYDELS